MSESHTIVGLGTRTDHVAAAPGVDPVALRLNPEECALLALVGRAARIDAVLARSGLPEPRAIAVLLALRAKGALVPARVSMPQAAAQPVDAGLAEEVELEPARKQEILALDRALDQHDHFSVLGLAPGASAADVKAAYYEASRRFHPDRFYGKNLGSFRARIERIFRRLSEAQAVLTQPDKRAAYLKAHPELAAPAAPTPAPFDPAEAERSAERRARLARHPYLARTQRLNELLARARAALERGAYEQAFAELNQVTAVDAQNAEAALLLAETRRRHEALRAERELARGKELERSGDLQGALAALRLAATLDVGNAEAAFRAASVGRSAGLDAKEVRVLALRAVELQPRRAAYHLLLAQVHLESGAKKLAKKHLEEVLALEPQHAEAKAQLKKLRWPF
ncbi:MULTISPECIES: J domain-containing protein [Myxococcaceae]|uniref:J domain-containing protein n=1 Tax=Myxococcaceae TaxID=31 RepID=UPI00188FE204|nr:MULTISPECIES: J domain-containing protein [Myxococcaceae]MBF5041227.1 J domain-containing protein [Simulacricoccus sp. 17bor-14]